MLERVLAACASGFLFLSANGICIGACPCAVPEPDQGCCPGDDTESGPLPCTCAEDHLVSEPIYTGPDLLPKIETDLTEEILQGSEKREREKIEFESEPVPRWLKLKTFLN